MKRSRELFAAAVAGVVAVFLTGVGSHELGIRGDVAALPPLFVGVLVAAFILHRFVLDGGDGRATD